MPGFEMSIALHGEGVPPTRRQILTRSFAPSVVFGLVVWWLPDVAMYWPSGETATSTIRGLFALVVVLHAADEEPLCVYSTQRPSDGGDTGAGRPPAATLQLG